MSRPEARLALEQKVRHGAPHPADDPKHLHLGDIRTAPELYQFRRPMEHASRAHVHDMARKVKEQQTLDPLCVWWGGDDWYCLDGHHRLEAYEVGKWPHTEPVPVRVHRGSVVSAMLKAARSNTPSKLQMTSREKSQAAWELVVTTETAEASAASIAAATTVSKRQVFIMRDVKKSLLAKEPGRDLSLDTWERARNEHAGKDLPEVDWEEQAEVEARQLAGQICTALGERGHKVVTLRPEVMARALELFDQRLPGFLADHWRHLHDARDLGIEEDEDEF